MAAAARATRRSHSPMSSDSRPRRLAVEHLEDRRLLSATRASDAVNLFAMDVYEQMQREEGNLFFSPLSVATALAMAYAGAAGQTAAEMEQVLHLGAEPGIHESFGELIASIEAHNESYVAPSDPLPWPLPGDPPDWWPTDGTVGSHELSIANAIWPDSSLAVEQGFLDIMQGEYDGHVQTLNYGDPEQAKATINQWVSQKTHGKIPALIDELGGGTVMVLTNAAYFNGYWELPFDRDYTAQDSFTLPGGGSISVSTMYTETFMPSTWIDGFGVLEMPFDSGANDADYSMVLVLPPTTGDTSLTPAVFSQIDAWLDSGPYAYDVLISLPKIDTAVATNLNSLLKGLGMPTAFELGAADFSGMTPGDIAISKVGHKATLRINEEGTTATAATEVQFYICFAKGTPVVTPDGSKPIEELQAGDLVLARDESNLEGELQPKRIEKVHHNRADILELTVRGQVIRTTAPHPFFAYGKGWTAAGDLRPGDKLSTNAFDWAEVEAVKFTQQNERVYNLRVADHHTYFVGGKEWGFAVWVHNNCGGEPEFFFNRPFHLMIRDNITGTIAFMGRIDDPRQLNNSVEPIVVHANADFNGDLAVNGSDFLAWQRGAGMIAGAQPGDGDSDGDGDVDAGDLDQWTQAYGQTTPAVAATAAPPALELVDAAMALEWLQPDAVAVDAPLAEEVLQLWAEPAPTAAAEDIDADSVAVAVDGKAPTRQPVDEAADTDTQWQEELIGSALNE